jgi:hypothetical protein
MIRALLLIISFLAVTAEAHVGSPDVFYDGMVGPYPARITIRMPGVVPGRAEISVRVQNSEPVEVSFLPLYSRTAVTNAPPPDIGRLVRGETNLYTGELWLMSFGAYSVEVRIKGEQGQGSAQIPVTSMAIRQLALPGVLEKILLLMATVLVVGGIGVAAAAGREAALSPGATLGRAERWKGFLSAMIAAILCAVALAGGKHWWNSEENAFRSHLHEGAWPDLDAAVSVAEGQRILQLTIGKKFFERNRRVGLIPDHGKLIHLFLVREGSRDTFAHLHPIRTGDSVFEVPLPPLPAGRYAIFCDLTFEGGVSSTATNSVDVPPPGVAPAGESFTVKAKPDPDDSWADGIAAVRAADGNPVCRLPDGTRVSWSIEKPLRTKQDASLRFTVTGPSGEPVALEPYMGMLCHAAVLRNDGAVFAHLHPAGNFSMAAQSYFQNKLASETDPGAENSAAHGMDHSMHRDHSGGAVSSVYLPYEFPAAGDYRIWVQFKIGGRVSTAIFDAHVGS